MIQVTAQTRILVAVEPVDFRKGIDGLAQLCKTVFGKDPFSGTMFVFHNRRSTSIKILYYDGQGFWLCMRTRQEPLFNSSTRSSKRTITWDTPNPWASI